MGELAKDLLSGARRIVVIDVEATCWKKGMFNKQKETIEIGALELKSDRTFQTFVKPVRHPKLSTFCKELTNIRQEDVEGAPLFPQAMYNFLAWAEPIDQVVIASWSHYDVWQLDLDLENHNLPKLSLPYLDIKKLSTRMIGGKSFTESALHFGIEIGAGRHRALSDARAAAAILEQLIGAR